ncbi:unnamed protein product [Rotaria sordida]|uniref:Uncharacterized protein n=1 Tax=Rotaria sordida TaxID=392033 RepID=A0A813WEG0_9BILA|nr:unnamed protein product [Rotaria sordida]CAF1013733.1 unnamed protein product [Rotaria sordida]CAF1116593.1 unnamed protein product [Rotaria sordida]CAF4017639.1 unnamed protein product [Rotaria sordida]
MKLFPLLFVIYLVTINVQISSAEIDCTSMPLNVLQLINTNLTILSGIKKFQKLTSLTIRLDNSITGQHLPSEFGQLISLSNLGLTDDKNLEDLPYDIKYLTQ